MVKALGARLVVVSNFLPFAGERDGPLEQRLAAGLWQGLRCSSKPLSARLPPNVSPSHRYYAGFSKGKKDQSCLCLLPKQDSTRPPHQGLLRVPPESSGFGTTFTRRSMPVVSCSEFAIAIANRSNDVVLSARGIVDTMAKKGTRQSDCSFT